MNLQNQNKNKKKFDNFIRYSSLGFEMMAIIGLFTFLGYKTDQWLNNEFKGFTLAFMILSVITAIIYATRNLLKK
jgi:intracellular septation protein A